MTITMTRPVAEHGTIPRAVPAWFRTVMVATDFSSASRSATDAALRLAAALDARLLAVNVIDPKAPRLSTGRMAARVDQVRSESEEHAQSLVARGRAMAVKVDFLVWQGDPGEAILDAAASEGADLIVVGSHRRGAVGRFLIGSVSDHVVRRSPCPVVVVPPFVRDESQVTADAQGSTEPTAARPGGS